MRISEPQYGANFVGRDLEIHELKRKIRNNGVVIVIGDRGIGKTNLMKILEEIFKTETECYYIESGSLFSIEMNRIFMPEQTTTGASGSLGLFGFSIGVGRNRKPREPSVLECMEKSNAKIIFVENAHELKKEENEIIFAAAYRNNRLRFVLEIATPNFPDVKLNISPDQIVELKKLRDEDIEKIIRKECLNFPEAVVKKMIFLTKGYPYIARSFAYICDKKDTPDEMLEFLDTLRDDDIKYNLDRVHKEILGTLGKDAQDVIKKLAIAPPVLTKRLIMAFCDEEIDNALIDINERGILRYDKNFSWIYHPLFRDYLRSPKIQPIAIGKKKELYCKAMEQVKSEFDSIYLLLEAMKEPNIFKDLVDITENYSSIYFVGSQSYTWGKLDLAILAWSRILKKAKESKSKEWESIAIINLGLISKIKGDFDKTMEYYERSLKLETELGYKEGMAANYGNIGVIYQVKGDLDKALEYYEKSLGLAAEMGNKIGIASSYLNKGNIYRIKGDLERALEHHEKALELNEELGYKEGVAHTYGDMGTIYQTKEDFDKALDCYEKALELNEELGRKKGMAANYGNIGAIHHT